MTILKERGICNMANLDLTKYGITGTTEIVHNPSYELLFEEETKPELVGITGTTEIVQILPTSCCSRKRPSPNW